ncbi:MAG TPA: DUF6496 domain-containing protein [Candidatus Saccharimonadales bacterium]|nr:DUF6496 domain-containing protein [Candidatus Saccharimonadales bacterium]
MAKKKTSSKKTPKSVIKSSVGKRKIHKVMHEAKVGELHSGGDSGPVVKSRKQAIAIALSEARKAAGKKSKSAKKSKAKAKPKKAVKRTAKKSVKKSTKRRVKKSAAKKK